MSEPSGRQDASEVHAAVDLHKGWAVAIVVTVVFAVIAILAGTPSQGSAILPEHALPTPEPSMPFESGAHDQPGTISLPAPEFKTEEVLDSIEETGKPCSACHNQDLQTNPERRELSTHDDFVLRHDEENRWCLDCHDADDRDKLRLASGKLIEYEESHLLCGQCHGDKHRDWRAGIHGRRTGQWNGEKQYMLCVHCHSAHAPRFQPIKPMPPPKRQGEIR